MKQTHREDLRCWSRFDPARGLDFNAWAWLRPGGTVLVDPLPLSDHERATLEAAGPVATVVVTNSDHTRATAELAGRYGAEIVGPRAEEGRLGIEADRWVGDGEEVAPGLRALELHGSKTPGELALVLEGTTLISGDLVRGQVGGRLNLLPDAKLVDRAAAVASLRRLLAAHEAIDAVLVGDGWPVFTGGQAALRRLLERLER